MPLKRRPLKTASVVATLHLKHLKVLVLVKPKTLLFIKLKTSIESMSMQQ
jgi:hypothetical protein